MSFDREVLTAIDFRDAAAAGAIRTSGCELVDRFFKPFGRDCYRFFFFLLSSRPVLPSFFELSR